MTALTVLALLMSPTSPPSEAAPAPAPPAAGDEDVRNDAASSATPATAAEHQRLVALQRQLADASLSCEQIAGLSSGLRCEPSPEMAFCRSIRLRLEQRLCPSKKPAPPGAATLPATAAAPAPAAAIPSTASATASRPPAPPPVATTTATRKQEMYAAFLQLDSVVRSERQRRSSGAPSPGLADLEHELTWLAVATLHEWPPGSKEALDIGRRLAVVLSPGMDSREIADVVLRWLLEGNLTPEELEASLQLVRRACAAPRSAATSRCRTILTQLGDRRKSEALALTLQWIEEGYESIRRTGQRTIDALSKRGSHVEDFDAAWAFYDLLDYIVAIETATDAGGVGPIPESPTAPYLLLVAGPDEVVAPPACPDFDPWQRYLEFFVRTLQGSGIPLGPQPLEVIAGQLDEVRERLPRLVQKGPYDDDGARWPLCDAYPPLCRPPFAGVFLLRFERLDAAGGGALRAGGSWWARGTTAVLTGELRPMSLDSCDGTTVALRARLAAADAFRQIPKARRAQSLAEEARREQEAQELLRPPSREVSPWWAATFAGLPFLAAERASATSRVLSTAIDSGLLLSAAYLAGAAVHHHNEYTRGVPRSLDRANDDLNAALWCMAGVLATRLVAGLVYAQLPQLWQQ